VVSLHGGHALDEAALGVANWLAALLALCPVVLYLTAAARLRLRGDAWPWPRDVSFAAGGISLLVAAKVRMLGGEFTAHMGQHLVVGMAAPLLLVLARPLTLALRIVTGQTRRGLVRVSRTRGVGWLVFPPVAALVDIGGMWLLYRTGLFAASHVDVWLHAAVHLHVLTSGLLFTFAVCQLDPLRHRHGLALRATSLIAAAAAHAVLAKTLYGEPPPGTAFTATDLARGAELMYYGGDLVEIAVALVLAAQWYAASDRAHSRARRRMASAAAREASDPARCGAELPRRQHGLGDD
jgi:putative membrane protein